MVASMLVGRTFHGVKSRASFLGVLKTPSRDMNERTCTKCHEIKPILAFRTKVRWGRVYVDSHCRGCEASYMRERPKETKALATKKWREKNIDKIRAMPKRIYTEKQKERIRELSAKRFAENRDEILAQMREKRRRDPEGERAKRREAYRRDPSSSVNADHKRKARLRGNDATMTRAQWKSVLAWFENKCAYCQLWFERLTQDHVIPISRGGAHAVDNIVPACRTCNARKYARTPEQAGMPIYWPAKPLVLETV